MRRLISVRTLLLALLVSLVPADCGGRIDSNWTAGHTGVRATGLSGGGLPVDAGVLGLRRCGILLGAWSLGGAAARGRALDAGLLGLE